jgi:arsenate reductase (thioredoxin)
MPEHYNVLFLFTGNSARSIMAEAIMNSMGQNYMGQNYMGQNDKRRPKFTAYSAGSHPTGAVRPEAIAQIESAGLPTAGLRSKSWEEFAKPGAPHLDFVFTVCDNAANEVCPIWPGEPLTAHWGIPDPAAVKGTASDSESDSDSDSDIERAYREAFMTLERRIGLFLSLPLASIDKLAIKREIGNIGQQ